MRVRLKKRKQMELVELAKKGMTWHQLSNMLNLNEKYIRSELKNEQRLLPEKVYSKLCDITKMNFNRFIIEKKDDNWGRAKGGLNSEGNTKTFNCPGESEDLAELFGTILGDGHVDCYTPNNKIRCYALKISGHSKEDFDYLSRHVSNLIKKTLNENPKVKLIDGGNDMFIRANGREMIKFIMKKGIMPGNKKRNNQGIPSWIKRNKDYLLSCIRGLIDTDGSVHYISKNNKNIRISFTSYIPCLMNDVRGALIELGLNPSKIISEKQIFLSSKENVKKYISDIGFRNEKHLNRLKKLVNQAPIV